MNIPEQYLNALVEISQEINSIQELETLLGRILDIALQQLSADRGFILLQEAPIERLFLQPPRTLIRKRLAELLKFPLPQFRKLLPL